MEAGGDMRWHRLLLLGNCLVRRHSGVCICITRVLYTVTENDEVTLYERERWVLCLKLVTSDVPNKIVWRS